MGGRRRQRPIGAALARGLVVGVANKKQKTNRAPNQPLLKPPAASNDAKTAASDKLSTLIKPGALSNQNCYFCKKFQMLQAWNGCELIKIF